MRPSALEWRIVRYARDDEQLQETDLDRLIAKQREEKRVAAAAAAGEAAGEADGAGGGAEEASPSTATTGEAQPHRALLIAFGLPSSRCPSACPFAIPFLEIDYVGRAMCALVRRSCASVRESGASPFIACSLTTHHHADAPVTPSPASYATVCLRELTKQPMGTMHHAGLSAAAASASASADPMEG